MLRLGLRLRIGLGFLVMYIRRFIIIVTLAKMYFNLLLPKLQSSCYQKGNMDNNDKHKLFQ